MLMRPLFNHGNQLPLLALVHVDRPFHFHLKSQHRFYLQISNFDFLSDLSQEGFLRLAIRWKIAQPHSAAVCVREIFIPLERIL